MATVETSTVVGQRRRQGPVPPSHDSAVAARPALAASPALRTFPSRRQRRRARRGASAGARARRAVGLPAWRQPAVAEPSADGGLPGGHARVGARVQYLPLATLARSRRLRSRGVAGSELLALDDLGAIAGDRDAEHALFDLYNRAKAEGSALLFAADATPVAARASDLPDLRSRLGACTQFALKPLDDAERRDVLKAAGGLARHRAGRQRAGLAVRPLCARSGRAARSARPARSGLAGGAAADHRAVPARLPARNRARRLSTL